MGMRETKYSARVAGKKLHYRVDVNTDETDKQGLGGASNNKWEFGVCF